MDQKQRNRIAWALAVILIPVFIYLMAVNVFKVGDASDPAPVAVAPEPPPVAAPAPVAETQTRKRTVRRPDDDTLAAQREIAARMPVRNPFIPHESRLKGKSDETDVKQFNYKVTAVILVPGSRSRMAMIDGSLYEEGDRIGAWTIVKVDSREVVFDDGTQRRVVGVK